MVEVKENELKDDEHPMENCVICAFVKKQYQNNNTERKFYCLKKHAEVSPLDSCNDFMDWREASWDDIKTIWEGL